MSNTPQSNSIKGLWIFTTLSCNCNLNLSAANSQAWLLIACKICRHSRRKCSSLAWCWRISRTQLAWIYLMLFSTVWKLQAWHFTLKSRSVAFPQIFLEKQPVPNQISTCCYQGNPSEVFLPSEPHELQSAWGCMGTAFCLSNTSWGGMDRKSGEYQTGWDSPLAHHTEDALSLPAALPTATFRRKCIVYQLVWQRVLSIWALLWHPVSGLPLGLPWHWRYCQPDIRASLMTMRKLVECFVFSKATWMVVSPPLDSAACKVKTPYLLQEQKNA